MGLERKTDVRADQPLSDSDDDDDDNYVGYVSAEKQETFKNGRRMSSGMGAGGMVGGTTNRARPLGLLGARRPLGNSPTVENGQCWSYCTEKTSLIIDFSISWDMAGL